MRHLSCLRNVYLSPPPLASSWREGKMIVEPCHDASKTSQCKPYWILCLGRGSSDSLCLGNGNCTWDQEVSPISSLSIHIVWTLVVLNPCIEIFCPQGKVFVVFAISSGSPMFVPTVNFKEVLAWCFP